MHWVKYVHLWVPARLWPVAPVGLGSEPLNTYVHLDAPGQRKLSRYCESSPMGLQKLLSFFETYFSIYFGAPGGNLLLTLLLIILGKGLLTLLCQS